MAHRSQSSSVGDNPLDPNYLPPHYREEYRLAIDALVDHDLQGYHEFLQSADVVEFLAQPEIQHIKSTIQGPSQGPGHTSSLPELTYQEDADGSSDTYWPVHSDLAAPGLDLGWPMQQHSFIGPTEVTTLVNPSDPDMPSIKEQARRLIKNAQQVIAVVMDMFTDIDIFSDLLDAAARGVPVYILLDEHDAHHFVAMAANCRVNLDLVHMLRVRTVAGITYFCRTGKSFKGQVKDRFLLADCRAVLSGNYSFMWSYEKIHRCIAHLFLGELVTTFDEEFRILFAQSQPLVVDQALVPASDTSSTSSYYSSQFGLKRTQSLRNTRSFLRQPELPSSSFPFGDSDRNATHAFRRNDLFRHTMEPGPGITIGKYSQQQFRMQQSFLEQGRSIVSRQMEMSSSGFKRHSYAEGTQESYSSSRQYMKQRVMNNLEETDLHREQSQYYHEGPGPGSGHGHYDRHRVPHLAIDQYSDSSYPTEPEPPPPPGSYGRDYLSSDDLKHDSEHNAAPAAGRYGGGSAHKRPTLSQAYACQSSPTHPHPPEKQVFPNPADQRDPDSSARQGLRSWRINSYLNTCEDGGEEGLPLPMGSDAFEDPQQSPSESSAPRYGSREQANVPSSKPRPDALRPRFGKPLKPEPTGKDYTSTATTRDLISSFSDWKHSGEREREREREVEREREREYERGGTREVGVDVEVGPEAVLSKHESFRTRINPLLQRSSRLRSSLIFSSSKMETHNSGLGLQTATEEDETLDPMRTTSIVAQILEKRRSMSREPYDWRRKAEDKEKEKEETGIREERGIKEEPLKSSQEVHTQQPEETVSSKPQTSSAMNMNDPASRLQYFKDLAAKRKSPKIGTIETSVKPAEPEKKPGVPDKPPPITTAPKVPSVSISQPEPEPEPKKSDLSSKLAELTRRSSFRGTKPPVVPTKPSTVAQPKPPEPPAPAPKEEAEKKEPHKTLKPLPSPKIFKRDGLKIKSLNPRRVSCGEEVLTATDATDAEKSELKKSRTHSSSGMTRAESKDGLQKNSGSNTSINTIGEGKEGKLDFLKKQTQRLKGFLGPKDKDKKAAAADEKSMSTVQEVASKAAGSKDASDSSAANHKGPVTSTSRYQTSGGSVLFSSNLRDDTKVILEQISANSQKNRLEREEAAGDKGGDGGEKGLERNNSVKKSRFLRPQTNPQEREGLLKRIESMRKEKKVYSRFEMGNSLG